MFVQQKMSFVLLSAFTLAMSLTAFNRAAEPEKDSKSADSPEMRQALDWLDGFRKLQVLFHDKDIKRLRGEIAEFTPAEVKEWLTKTQEVRDALDSTEWKSTRTWLKQFLQVQAIYSDEQLDEFQEKAKEAAKTSPKEFKAMLAKIMQEHARLSKGAANSAQLREQQLAINQAYRKEAFAQREAARRAAEKSAANTPKSQTNPVPKKQYTRQPPLVDSLDAARWAVMRNFWRR